MDIIDALILGIVQGLTEFLPVSSSGHLVLGKELLGVEAVDNVTFEVVVHAATVFATITVFYKYIWNVIKGSLTFKYNPQSQYLLKIGVSMFPVLIVGLFFKDEVEALFGEGPLMVGFMLLITSFLLFLTTRVKDGDRDISYRDAFIIGLAQAFAVLPGISRSGSTISTGLLLGNRRSEIAQFSFLMVLVPILGQAFLEMVGGEFSPASSGIPTASLIVGFLAAYISGLLACRAMIELVKRGGLKWFALYCFIAGMVSIITSLI